MGILYFELQWIFQNVELHVAAALGGAELLMALGAIKRNASP
jgi:hypothetical protein